MKHKIETGPDGGKYQHSKAGDRYLLEGKAIKKGPRNGRYQVYDKNKKRHLLK